MKNVLFYTGIHRFSLDDLVHMQEGYSESLTSIAKALININSPVILTGCVVTVASQNYSVTAGAVFYNGEIYQVDAHAINSATVPNWVTETTWRNNDPVLYKDGISHNVHQINKIKLDSVAGISQWNQIRRFEHVLWNNISDVGDVVMQVVASADFDGTGLGKSYTRWEGWALMNGQNGTMDMGGFFPVGQKTSDPDFDTIGDTGGSKTVSLTESQMPDHAHTYEGVNTVGSGGEWVGGNAGSGSTYARATKTSNFTGGSGAQSAGAGQPHENLPPFKTLRFVQKIA